jgi:hypothetical protein
MHAGSDMLDGSADPGGEVRRSADLRTRVLTLTSALRGGLDRLAGQPGDDAAIETLRSVGREIADAGADAQLAPLASAADGFCGLAAEPADAGRPPLAGDRLLHAVGLIEQVLDGCLEGMNAEQLARLCHAIAGRELGLADEDDDAIDLAFDAAPGAPVPPHRLRDTPPAPPGATRPPHEQELFDAFAAEALDALDQCEDRVLLFELAPPGADRFADIAAELATVCDAGAAVGLEGLAAPTAGNDADAVLECIDAVRERIEAAWADCAAAAVDPAMLLPLDELFLRLRRNARDVARRHGGRLAIETRGGDLRITAALADRIYEPLAQVIAEAAAYVGPDAIPTLRVRAERDAHMLALAIDMAGDAAHPAEAEARETLQWIDARRPASDDETTRLVYKPGFVNVVQIVTG